MKLKYIIIGFILAVVICLASIYMLVDSFNPSSIIEEKKSISSSIKLTSEYQKINDHEYNYIIPKDRKFHITIKSDFLDNTPLLLDGRELEENTISDGLHGYKTYSTDYYIKPAKHTLSTLTETIIINVIYEFDRAKYLDDIKKTWIYNQDFVSLTNEGILLKNNSRDYRFFEFGRKYEEPISVDFYLSWKKFVPGTSIYFGKTIYFTFNNSSVFIMRKTSGLGVDQLIEKVAIDKIIVGKIYRIQSIKNGNIYKLLINNKEKAIYKDTLYKNRYRSIGITVPKNGSEILLSKIIIKED